MVAQASSPASTPSYVGFKPETESETETGPEAEDPHCGVDVHVRVKAVAQSKPISVPEPVAVFVAEEPVWVTKSNSEARKSETPAFWCGRVLEHPASQRRAAPRESARKTQVSALNPGVDASGGLL